MGQIVNAISLEKGLRTEFMKAYSAGENLPLIMSLATVIKSTASKEDFGWLGSVPQMQEFKDEKAPKGLLDFDYTIKNVPYEATIKVDKFDIRNDQYGMIKTRIADLANRAKQFPAKLIMQLIVNGSTQLAYDGQPFFSASHSEGKSGTQTNIVTGTGVAALATLEADFNSAVTLMAGLKDDQGEPIDEGMQRDLVVVCPLGLVPMFEKLFGTELISNTTNTLKNRARVIGSGRLTGNDWYVFDMSGVVKPIILQENMPVEFGALEGDSDEGFKRRFYLYGVEWYGNVGYGMWQKAVKVDN
jgi:phage major head subunit gpT-like protein